MTGELLPVVCQGQFYYVENRQKNFRQYEVEVDLPANETDRALYYIKKHLISMAIQSKYPDFGFAGVRTCEIVTDVPVAVAGGDVIEDMSKIDDEGDLFAAADVSVSDEFSDVEDIVSE